jgi:hypothetical protein
VAVQARGRRQAITGKRRQRQKLMREANVNKIDRHSLFTHFYFGFWIEKNPVAAAPGSDLGSWTLDFIDAENAYFDHQ